MPGHDIRSGFYCLVKQDNRRRAPPPFCTGPRCGFLSVRPCSTDSKATLNSRAWEPTGAPRFWPASPPFLTMAYIVLVNPAILAAAGMPLAAVTAATCLSAGFASIMMGVVARYPITLAPGMGLNVYFAYSVCIRMHVPWQTALGAVFPLRRHFYGDHRRGHPADDSARHSPRTLRRRRQRHRPLHRTDRLSKRRNYRRRSHDHGRHGQPAQPHRGARPAGAAADGGSGSEEGARRDPDRRTIDHRPRLGAGPRALDARQRRLSLTDLRPPSSSTSAARSTKACWRLCSSSSL